MFSSQLGHDDVTTGREIVLKLNSETVSRILKRANGGRCLEAGSNRSITNLVRVTSQSLSNERVADDDDDISTCKVYLFG